MGYQSAFKRREYKYLLDPDQAQRVMAFVHEHAVPDEYGVSTVVSVYLDTPDWLLARRSIERPSYKEKLRVRAYLPCDSCEQPEQSPAATHKTDASPEVAFIEIKKKYRSTVGKRRIAASRRDSAAFLAGDTSMLGSGPIDREIACFIKRYEQLRASIRISCRREAFRCTDDSGVRITFDRDIRWCRENAPSFAEQQQRESQAKDRYGGRVIPEHYTLMEIKCEGSMPLWMAHFLSSEKIFRRPFSKYGTAYRRMKSMATQQPKTQTAPSRRSRARKATRKETRNATRPALRPNQTAPLLSR